MDTKYFEIYLDPPEEVTALGRSLRELIHRIVTLESLPLPIEAEVSRLREQVDAISARLAEHVRIDPTPRLRTETANGVRPYYVQGALVGDHNPLVPIFETEHVDGVTAGKVRFEAGFEGPPGCVHGGFVALFFDQVLGYHNVVQGVAAMTATLEVRYRRPTPVLTDLSFEVHTGECSERQVVNEGWLEVGGVRVSEARATFARPQVGNFMHHMQKRIDGQG